MPTALQNLITSLVRVAWLQRARSGATEKLDRVPFDSTFMIFYVLYYPSESVDVPMTPLTSLTTSKRIGPLNKQISSK